MSVGIKSLAEIEYLRKANEIVALALAEVQRNAKIGVSLEELDKIAEDFINSHNAKPSFKGLYGFPKSICLSVNEVIIHGIPNDYKLKNGDILGVDIGVEYKGWFGDSAITFGIGEISVENKKLIACSQAVLENAISSLKSGMRFRDLSKILESSILSNGFVPLRGYCGHGIGRKPHEEPEIPNFVDSAMRHNDTKIRDGMVFCIEPMVCHKNGNPKILKDKWSVVAADGLNGSHHEHTIAMVGGKAVILSQEQ